MWNFALPLLAGLGLSVGLPAPGAAQPAPQVEICGTLEFVVEPPSRRFAWGGYVGWRVTAGGKTYDLNLRHDPDLEGLAKELNGTRVVVRGTLTEQRLAIGRRAPPGGGPVFMDAMVVHLRVINVTSLRGLHWACER
jgi:hypothetical protein